MQIDSSALSNGLLLLLYVLLVVSVAAFLALRASGKAGPVNRLDVRHGSTTILKVVFREYWHWITRPVESALIRRGISPNRITTAGLFLACAAGLLYSAGFVGLAGWTLVLSGSCDIFDGRIARATGRTAPSGAFYDSVLDRVGDAAVFIGITTLMRHTPWLHIALLAMAGSFMVSYVRSRAEAAGVRCDMGLMQRPERVFLLAAASVSDPLLRLWLPAALQTTLPFLLSGAVAVIAVLSWHTAFQRFVHGLRQIDAIPQVKAAVR